MCYYPYIAFEGPIAAGKTTLSTLFARHLGSDLLLEDFDNNEFLADFYAHRRRWSLAMQLWFLAARVPPLRSIRKPRLSTLVADYSARKDPLFARLLLEGRELRLFERIAAMVAADIAQPDLIVYVDANNETLLSRIKGRDRAYEDSIDHTYLDTLREAYDKDLTASDLNVLRYDTSALDLGSETQLHRLYELISTSVPGAGNRP